MDAQIEPAVAMGAFPGVTPGRQGAGTRPPIDYPHAGRPAIRDHIAIEAGTLLDDVRRALESDFEAATKIAERLAALLANECQDDLPSAPIRGGLAPWQERKIQQVIEEGLEGPLRVKALAKLVSLSPSHFCRAFKHSFGEPPHSYVIKMRVERAKSLMLTTSEGLSQIALACGLVDQAHLCRCFRQATGITPAVWRRRNHATESKPCDRMTRADKVSAGIRGAGGRDGEYPI